MKRLAILFALFAGAAHAQAPSPAQMGIDKQNVIQALSALDMSGRWVQLGLVDSTRHIFGLEQPGVGAIPISLQTIYQRTISSQDYGDSASPGSSSCTPVTGHPERVQLAAGHDFKVGQDITCFRWGNAATAIRPSALTAAQTGTNDGSNTTINYEIVAVDKNFGVSAAATLTITNGNAKQTTPNPVVITGTPADYVTPVCVYKQVGTGAWTYLGCAPPSLTATLVSGGSGYNQTVTRGIGWEWSSSTSNGDCVRPASGVINVDNSGTGGSIGKITSVSLRSYWLGCTNTLPTFKVPLAAGAGTGASVTLAMTWTFSDTGQGDSGTLFAPLEFLTPPPSGGQNQHWVATITGFDSTGNIATISQPAPNPVGGGPLAVHDETRAINACLATAGAIPGTNSNLVYKRACELACGSHRTTGPINLPNAGGVGLVATNAYQNCAQIYASGFFNTIYAPNQYDQSILGFYINDYEKVGGWSVYLDHVHRFTLTRNHATNGAGGFFALGFNDLRMFNNRANGMWGPGKSDFLMSQASDYISCCVIGVDNYSNDNFKFSAVGNLGQGGTTRANWLIDGTATVIGIDNATSNPEGDGFWLGDTYAPNKVTTQGGGLLASWGPSFFQQIHLSCEYAAAHCVDITGGDIVHITDGLSHYGRNTSSLFIGPNVNHSEWIGGRVTNGGRMGIDLWGTNMKFVGVSDIWNNTGAPYGSPCVSATLTASASAGVLTVTAISGWDTSLETAPPLGPNCPLYDNGNVTVPPLTITSQLSGTTGGVGTYQLNQTTLTFASMTLYAGFPDIVFEPTGDNNVYNSGMLSDLMKKWTSVPAVFMPGSTGNTFLGNVFNLHQSNCVVDASGGFTNIIGSNANDSCPRQIVDYAHHAIGMGSYNPYNDLGGNPGLAISAPGNYDTRLAIIEATPSAQLATAQPNLGAALEESMVGDPNAYSFYKLRYNTGTPQQIMSIAAGVTGGIIIDASGGGAASPLLVNAGAQAGFQIEPYMSFVGGAKPTVTGCGTGATTSGQANSGSVTMGTNATASCGVVFANTHPAAPNQCNLSANNAAAAALSLYATALTTTGFTINAVTGPLTGANIGFQCF